MAAGSGLLIDQHLHHQHHTVDFSPFCSAVGPAPGLSDVSAVGTTSLGFARSEYQVNLHSASHRGVTF